MLSGNSDSGYILKSSEVNAEVLEQEAELALMKIMSVEFPNFQLHHNVTLYNNRASGDDNNKVQQYDGIVYGHLIDPIFVLVMEAKVTIHPKYFDQVRNKAALFKKYVLFEAQQQ